MTKSKTPNSPPTDRVPIVSRSCPEGVPGADASRSCLSVPPPTGTDTISEPLTIVSPTMSQPRRCRTCGCTDNNACYPPCWWVEAELCSACQPMDGRP